MDRTFDVTISKSRGGGVSRYLLLIVGVVMTTITLLLLIGVILYYLIYLKLSFEELLRKIPLWFYVAAFIVSIAVIVGGFIVMFLNRKRVETKTMNIRDILIDNDIINGLNTIRTGAEDNFIRAGDLSRMRKLVEFISKKYPEERVESDYIYRRIMDPGVESINKTNEIDRARFYLFLGERVLTKFLDHIETTDFIRDLIYAKSPKYQKLYSEGEIDTPYLERQRSIYENQLIILNYLYKIKPRDTLKILITEFTKIYNILESRLSN